MCVQWERFKLSDAYVGVPRQLADECHLLIGVDITLADAKYILNK
jgi:hypothetical protein